MNQSLSWLVSGSLGFIFIIYLLFLGFYFAFSCCWSVAEVYISTVDVTQLHHIMEEHPAASSCDVDTGGPCHYWTEEDDYRQLGILLLLRPFLFLSGRRPRPLLYHLLLLRLFILFGALLLWLWAWLSSKRWLPDWPVSFLSLRPHLYKKNTPGIA